MKYFQACAFKTSLKGKWQEGIACVSYLDSNDVSFVLNSNGVKQKNIYDYHLHSFTTETPFQYIVLQ